MARRSMALLVFLLALAATAVYAQTTEATRVSNDEHGFAFTVEAGSLVTYEENGIGFNCLHNPAGGGKGTKPDYGLQVFARTTFPVSKDEAVAAKLTPAEAQDLTVAGVRNNTRLSELLKGVMASHGRTALGEASIKSTGGSSIKVPYFIWDKTVGSLTHHALTYVVIHGDRFVIVQVEGARPFTDAQVKWFTTRLELFEPKPVK